MINGTFQKESNTLVEYGSINKNKPHFLNEERHSRQREQAEHVCLRNKNSLVIEQVQGVKHHARRTKLLR